MPLDTTDSAATPSPSRLLSSEESVTVLRAARSLACGACCLPHGMVTFWGLWRALLLHECTALQVWSRPAAHLYQVLESTGFLRVTSV